MFRFIKYGLVVAGLLAAGSALGAEGASPPPAPAAPPVDPVAKNLGLAIESLTNGINMYAQEQDREKAALREQIEKLKAAAAKPPAPKGKAK